MTRLAHRRPGEPGFTLLELLVAIFVLGFVILLSSQGLHFGLRASRVVAGEHREEMLAVDQAVRRMIAQADPGVYPDPATLRGTADALDMTTELPGSGDGLPQRADAVLSVADGRLVLRWRPHRHAELFGAGPAWATAILSEGVGRVEFAYQGGRSPGWAATWSGDRLPALVRVSIVFAEHSGKRWPPIIAAPLREAIEE